MCQSKNKTELFEIKNKFRFKKCLNNPNKHAIKKTP